MKIEQRTLEAALLPSIDKTATDRGRLSLGLQIGWGLGSMGTVTVLYIQSVFLLFFFTAILGMQPGFAGTLILTAKIFDLVWGLTVGKLSDRAHSRWGRRRPFLLAGAAVTVIGIIFVFNPPVISPPVQILTLILMGVGYGLFNVPYIAMPAEMTDDPAARTRLISWRIVFVSVAILFAVSVLPLLVTRAGGGRGGYAVLSEVTAGVVGFSMFFSFLTTASARFTARAESGNAGEGDWAAVISNRPFLLLMAAKILQLVGLAVNSAILLFFFSAVLGGDGHNVALWGLISNSVAILSVPIWARIAQGREKRNIYMVGIIFYALVMLSWLFAGYGESFALISVRAVLVGPFIAGVLLMGQAMIPDTIEYDRKKSGVAREGVYSGVYNFVEKGTSAAGPFIVGWILQLVGFNARATGLNAQSLYAVHGVYLAMAVIPATLYLISVIPLYYYRLTNEKLAHA